MGSPSPSPPPSLPPPSCDDFKDKKKNCKNCKNEKNCGKSKCKKCKKTCCNNGFPPWKSYSTSLGPQQWGFVTGARDLRTRTVARAVARLLDVPPMPFCVEIFPRDRRPRQGRT